MLFMPVLHSLLNKVLHLSTMQARATHICLDCGYIYFLQKPFDEQVRAAFKCLLLPLSSLHSSPIQIIIC